MWQDHQESDLRSNVESRPPNVAIRGAAHVFFFVGPSLVLASLLNFGGRIPRYAFHVAFLWGQGCPCLAQELLQANEVAFFQKLS